MIKTVIAREALDDALDRQQRWVDRHGDATAEYVNQVRQARALETDRLKTENRSLRRALRMAKASLPPEPR